MIKLDACSLIYLLKMDFIETLVKIDKQVYITEMVHEEVVIRGKKKGRADAYLCDKFIKKGDIKVHTSPENLLDINLGIGELEIMQNAIEHDCPCVIDDKKAQRVAISIGTKVKIVPLLLLEAFKLNIISEIEYKMFFDSWIHYADPPSELIELIKNAKDLIS